MFLTGLLRVEMLLFWCYFLRLEVQEGRVTKLHLEALPSILNMVFNLR